MKDILDIVVIIIFVIIVFGFIRGFNKQQIEKHTKKIDEIERREKEKDE